MTSKPAGAYAALRLVSVALTAILLAAMSVAEAAVRYKRSGEATLGGADALAGVPGACEIGPDRIWVKVDDRGECIAVHAVGKMTGAKRAIFYFEGDIPPSYRGNEEKLSRHLETMRKAFDSLSKPHGLPIVLVARPGTFGSTGNHADRRKLREYQVMRAAVEALAERFQIPEVTLAGQSGGATIVGALLTLGIMNVRCATPASGGYDLTAMLDWHSSRQGKQLHHREHPASLADEMNVMDRVGNVRRDQKRRIFVIGDVGDKVTPFSQQQKFATSLKSMGHHAEIIQAEGQGPDEHGLAMASLKAAVLCATGAGDAEIRRAVGK